MIPMRQSGIGSRHLAHQTRAQFFRSALAKAELRGNECSAEFRTEMVAIGLQKVASIGLKK